jgi:hypothetical protein
MWAGLREALRRVFVISFEPQARMKSTILSRENAGR